MQLGRIDGRGLAAAGANRRGDERRREHLAGAGDRVEQPRRQLVHHRQAETELLEPIEPAVDVGDDGVARDGIRHDRRRRRPCASRADAGESGDPSAPWTPCCAASMSALVTPLIADVTTTTRWPWSSADVDERGGLGNALGGPDRGPAELHDDEHMARSIIEATRPRMPSGMRALRRGRSLHGSPKRHQRLIKLPGFGQVDVLERALGVRTRSRPTCSNSVIGEPVAVWI